jgi:CcmD family protein
MTALAAAYGIAWALIGSYLGWLSLQNRRLRRRMEAIERNEG